MVSCCQLSTYNQCGGRGSVQASCCSDSSISSSFSMAAGRMVSPSGRFALLVSVGACVYTCGGCGCVHVCGCIPGVCVCDVCDHSSLSGGYPYATLPNKDVLPSLHQGQRLKKPDNCSEEMYVSHSLTTTF